MRELSALLIGAAIFDAAPCEHRRRRRHGEVELDVISRIKPPACEIFAHIRAISKRGIASPCHSIPGGLRAGNLRLVKPYGLLQSLAVIQSRSLRLNVPVSDRKANYQQRRRYSSGRDGVTFQGIYQLRTDNE